MRRADGRLRPDATPVDRYRTHAVLNQAEPACGFNASHRRRGAAGRHRARGVGAQSLRGPARWPATNRQELARLANRHAPELKTHDRYGNRIDWVEFHPSWHALMTLAWKHEVPNLAARRRAGRPLCARRAVVPVEPGGARHRLSHGHGLRRPCGFRGRAGAGGLEAEVAGHRIRVQPARGRRQAVRGHRLRHDREAGRLGPAPDADHGALLAHGRLPRRGRALV